MRRNHALERLLGELNAMELECQIVRQGLSSRSTTSVADLAEQALQRGDARIRAIILSEDSIYHAIQEHIGPRGAEWLKEIDHARQKVIQDLDRIRTAVTDGHDVRAALEGYAHDLQWYAYLERSQAIPWIKEQGAGVLGREVDFRNEIQSDPVALPDLHKLARS